MNFFVPRLLIGIPLMAPQEGLLPYNRSTKTNSFLPQFHKPLTLMSVEKNTINLLTIKITFEFGNFIYEQLDNKYHKYNHITLKRGHDQNNMFRR